MSEIIKYIINYLIDDSSKKDYSSIIGYTNDQKLYENYKIVIIPSKFFDSYGKQESLPKVPLQEFQETPILYGTPEIEKVNGTTIIHADLIASSFFLLSRYEEWIKDDTRDKHGRFPGTESTPYKAGFIHRPIVQEYGKILRTLLKKEGVIIENRTVGFSKVVLTHDVDQISKYRTLKSIINGFLKKEDAIKTIFKSFLKNIENDPYYTFPWIFDINSDFSKDFPRKLVEKIIFIKSLILYLPEDKPYFDLFDKDVQKLFQLCEKHNHKIGLHASYYSGDDTNIILDEKEQLEIATSERITLNRHHFLRSKHPEDMQALIDNGIADDYTMGYADVAGFRLGTCKPVKWISLKDKTLTNLTLHPLEIMDRTLCDKRYMSLNYQQAFTHSTTIIKNTFLYNGELVLLWHNTILSEEKPYSQKKLYSELLKYIEELIKNG